MIRRLFLMVISNFFMTSLPIVIVFFWTAPLAGQEESAKEVASLREMLKEDRSTAEALALYPEDIREAIFNASMHPELISKIGGLQQKSSAAFRKIVSGLSKEERKEVWEITRYPGLVKLLVESGGTPEKVRKGLQKYDSKIQESAFHYGTEKSKQDVMAKVFELEQSVNSTSESLIREYPPGTQQAWRKMIGIPDVLSILGENLNL